MITHLQQPNDQNIDIVQSWRDSQLAAVVMMFVSNPQYCGIASGIGVSAGGAYALTDISCVPNQTFAHEIGHLAGARHDNDATQSPFAYGHGYVDTQQAFRTIMAVGTSCGNCARLNRWSTIEQTEPSTGRPLGNASFSNNTAVLRLRATSFRDFLTPSPVSFVSQVNYGAGQRPRFSWQGVSGATNYTAFRCETSSWGGSSCASLSFSYSSSGNTFQVEDLMRTLSGAYPPCAKQGRYYVTSFHPVDGIAQPSFSQPVVCLQ